MIHSLALDGMAPRWAARTSESGAPRGAVLIATLGMVLASILSLVSPDSAFMQLYGAATAGALVTWIIVMITSHGFSAEEGPRGPTNHEAPPVGCARRSDPRDRCGRRDLHCYALDPSPAVWIAGIPYLVILVASYLILARVRTLATPRNLLAEELR